MRARVEKVDVLGWNKSYTYVDLTDINQQSTTRGVVYRPDIEKLIECYVDANFSSGWAQIDADNAENVMLRTGYVIMYVGCTVL